MKINRILTLLIRVVLILLSFSLIAISCVLILADYELLTHDILQSLGKLHRIEEFQQLYLTRSTFTILRVITTVIAIIFTSLSIFVWCKIPEAVTWLLWWWNKFLRKSKLQINSFTILERRLIIIVWLIITLMNLYGCMRLPISYDEAWTYLNLSSKNILVSASYYPAPNNHILFSLLTNLTTWLPIDSKFAIRLPNLVIASASFFILLLILKEIFYPSIAIILNTLFYSLYPITLYSMHARGYFLYILFSVFIFYFFYINRYLRRIRYWTCYGLAAALGFYTIPSFLYAYLTVFTIAFAFFLYRKDANSTLKLFIISTIIAIGVVLLYVPVFLISGLGAVTNNTYVKTKSFNDIISHMPRHIIQTANWYTGNIAEYTYVFIGAFILITVILSLFRSERRLLAVSISISFICPVFFMMLHRTLPFERTWSYTVFFIVLCVGLLMTLLVSPDHIKRGLYFYCISILATGFLLFYSAYPKNYAIDYDSKKLADYLLAHNCHTMYIQSDYQEVLLYYYYSTHQQVYNIDNGFAGATLDNSKEYDCLILFKDAALQPKGIEYHSAEISPFINVYLKR